jgi:large subunit ribosomal protein L35
VSSRGAQFSATRDLLCVQAEHRADGEIFVAKKAKKLKLKTHRGAAKRFKITSTGKVLRMHSGKRHLLGTKKANRMRRLKKMTPVSPADAGNVHKMLPYS